MIPAVHNINHVNSGMFFLIAGPCVVENEQMPIDIAKYIKTITDRLEIPYIFKASYRKANRSRGDSFTSIGDDKAMMTLRQVRDLLKIPVLTDIHTEEEASIAAKYVDVLQIPAFLCRQTGLLKSAGETGKWVNIKKGQFASASSMEFAIQKVIQTGNHSVMITERGTTFGYEDLVVDFRNIPEMQRFKIPVCVDITHSLQQPNQASGITGGRPDLIETIAKAAIAVGADGIFLETHPDPAIAKSDGANMLRLDLLEDLLEKLVKIKRAISY
ncbi:MAG: 3-deoxy-8-phosphooctulonate synthase [Bacteroidales bacterium]|nr:3-deoxy-8-phosphooctulonate synthase [Bacteroidales bacterium]MDD4604075.1 3-deoxy-8-phosphooctulonate synthase [Bacteroidales bacterium]